MGQGGNLNLFHKLGFNVFGVDIAKNDIKIAQEIMPDKANQFRVISPEPDPELRFFPDIFKKSQMDST